MFPASSARYLQLLPPHVRPWLRVLLIIVLYGVCWYGLDRAAQALEIDGVISVWNPPAALDVALLLVLGPQWTPVIALGTMIDAWMVTPRRLSLPLMLVMSVIRMFGYGSVSVVLLRGLRIDPRLRHLRDVVCFVVVGSLLGPFFVALLQHGVAMLWGVERAQGWLERMLLAWAGIATGVVVFTPVVLIALRRMPRVWATTTPPPAPLQLRRPSRRAVAHGSVAALGLALGIYVAYGAPRASDLDYTYVVMLPLVWIAVRYELVGAVVAVVAINLGAAALVAGKVEAQQAFALQFGLMIVSQGGVLTGAIMRQRRQALDERLRLEHALMEMQRMESIGRMARGVAHDFNNLLQAIRGHIHIAMLDVAEGANPAGSLKDADLAVQRAADLAQQVLRSAAQEPVQQTALDLNALVGETTMLMQRALPPTVTIDLQLDPVLPPVVADTTQLRQVVLNLVSNAAEALHGSPGTITVQTAHGTDIDAPLPAQVLPPDRWICLSFTDTGWGMSVETQSQIFEPFFSTKTDGHGLGLGIVQGIVQAHGGSVTVESALGKGTTVRVWLPAAAASNQ